MSKIIQPLSFQSDRRFGIEYEVLAFDGKSRPDGGGQPLGIQVIAMIVHRAVPSDQVDLKGYEHTDNNTAFVVKPDSSCGVEVCTPILKGWNGLQRAVKVADAFRKDEQIKVDLRCSVHEHVEIVDLDQTQLGNIVAWWLKVEQVFMDSVPTSRKQNRYCVPLTRRQFVQHDTKIAGNELVKKVGQVKYLSANTNQYIKSGRKTIEFRIGEGEGCKDPFYVKCWTRLLIHFVEQAKNRPFPSNFDGTPWSSFLWLDPKDTFSMLGFDDDHELSPGLRQVRNWFIARLQKNMENTPLRSVAKKELLEITHKIKETEGIEITPEYLVPKDMDHALYGDEFKS